MIHNIKIVTNNPLVVEELSPQWAVEFVEGGYRQVLVTVRDYLHKGYQLYSHPLSGSIKPNETPYKSVMISRDAEGVNVENIMIMEDSIITCDKFPVKYPILPDHVDDDFRTIDFYLIRDALAQ